MAPEEIMSLRTIIECSELSEREIDTTARYIKCPLGKIQQN